MEQLDIITRLKRLNLSTTLATSHPRCLELVELLEMRKRYEFQTQSFGFMKWRFYLKNRVRNVEPINK